MIPEDRDRRVALGGGADRPNLNETRLEEGGRLEDPSGEFDGGRVAFRDCEGEVVRFIEKADAVFGCVAWLTNHRIIDALAGKPLAQIVVQKEDFLRPEHGVNWRGDVRQAYAKIRGLRRGWGWEIGGLQTLGYAKAASINSLSYQTEIDFEGVRCFGVSGHRSKTPPRMHHKFAVACREDSVATNSTAQEVEDGAALCYPRWVPYAVLTGSFNWSENATRSLENVVILNGPVAARFLAEYEQVLCASEPLDWTSQYVAPEFRVGS